MDKMTHTKFNFNNFLIGFSDAFDKVFEKNMNNIDFCSQRICYIALRLSSYRYFTAEHFSDLAAYSLLYSLDIPQKHLEKFPFIDHDIYKDKEIKSIIELSIFLENNIEIESSTIVNKDKIIETIVTSENYNTEIKENFEDLSSDLTFWLDLANQKQLSFNIYNFLEDFTIEIEYKKLVKISQIINEIIYAYTNNKNDNTIGEKCEQLCKVYNLDNKDISRMVIAANLHSIGKFFVSKEIHYKSNILTQQEIEMIKAIPYFSYSVLSSVYGFEDIAKLCSVYNERLDGTGFPYELSGSDLSLKDRALAIVVIYQALVEKKVYREAFTHQEAIEILQKEAISKKLDSSIVKDLDKLFQNNTK